MQTYDWRRFARLLRIDRPDCWDREDAHRLPWERGCPYWLETDGVYLHDLPLREAPPGLGEAEIEALHPGDGGKVLTLPATLPAIIGFLDSSGEYARLPGRLWPRLQRLAARAAAFSQAWERLDSRAWERLNARGIPFDPKAARKEKFIPLKVLLSWLEPLPAPWYSVPKLELFALAKRHIQIGHLKPRGPSWRYVPGTFDQPPETIDVRVDGEVIGQVTRWAGLMPLPDDLESPLIDVLEFAAWFREVCPEYLRLPAGFPGAAGEAAAGEVSDATARGAELDPGAADPPEATGDLPEPDWPTLKELAGAFQGLHKWDEHDWLRSFRTNTSPWITGAIRKAGKKGLGGRNTGNPVTLAMNLIDLEQRSGTNVAHLIRELDQRFEQPPLLAWRAIWQRGRL